MKRWFLIGMLISAWFLAGCGPSIVRTLPKVEPIETVTGSVDEFTTTLAASTNCAEIGAVITFTLTLENLRTKPMTLTDTPRLELVIEPQRTILNPTDVQRWSDDPAYPFIDAVLQPREVRHYEWVWQADPRYAATELHHEDGIRVRIDNGITLPSGSASGFVMNLGVGIRSMKAGTESGTALCKDLPR